MIRSFRITCLALVAVFATTPAAAQPVHPDPGIADVDKYEPTAPLGSEGVLVGLVVVPTDLRAAPERLLFYMPPESADSLCVELVSYDGQYTGRFRFTPPREPGWYFVLLPTLWGRILREYGTEDLAPLAHLGSACGERGLYVPAGWGARRSNARLRLLVNAQAGADWAFVDWSADTTRPYECVLLDKAARVAYDHSCDVGPPPSIGRMELRIVQMDGADPLDLVPVQVWVPRGL